MAILQDDEGVVRPGKSRQGETAELMSSREQGRISDEDEDTAARVAAGENKTSVSLDRKERKSLRLLYIGTVSWIFGWPSLIFPPPLSLCLKSIVTITDGGGCMHCSSSFFFDLRGCG